MTWAGCVAEEEAEIEIRRTINNLDSTCTLEFGIIQPMFSLALDRQERTPKQKKKQIINFPDDNQSSEKAEAEGRSRREKQKGEAEGGIFFNAFLNDASAPLEGVTPCSRCGRFQSFKRALGEKNEKLAILFFSGKCNNSL